MDVDSIPLGHDFREFIDEEIARSDALLVVIGHRWMDLLKARAGDPRDFVRMEIESALRRRIPVVPVYLGDDVAPPAESELPESIAALAYRHGIEVDPGRDFRVHCDRLAQKLKALLDPDARPRKEQGPEPAPRRRFATATPARIKNRGKIKSTYDFGTSRGSQFLEKLPLEERPEVRRLGHESGWPAGIRTLAQREKLSRYFRDYTAFVIATHDGDSLLWVPAAENQHMSEKMRPSEDFFIVIGSDGVEKV